jgi:hypothetical protein
MSFSDKEWEKIKQKHGMTISEILKAYPEEAEKAIEQYLEEKRAQNQAWWLEAKKAVWDFLFKEDK